MPLTLALDQGTTSSRTIAFDEGGKPLAVGQKEFQQHFPAAGLVEFARQDADCVVNALDLDEIPRGFEFRAGKATEVVPKLVAGWISGS